MKYGDDYKLVPATSIKHGHFVYMRPDLICCTIQIANICLAGDPGTKKFVLIDAGMPESAEKVIAACEQQYGAGCRPEAIVLTHGHFDHVGAIVELVQKWEVPVYAHELELPFLTGKTSYPKPDAFVQGGTVAKMSPLFPVQPVDLGPNVEKLPDDGTVPFMPDFQWIHTPGHTPGHVSLFREKDRTLIAGDAFVTVKQDSLYKVLTQKQEVQGPPRYLTTDWTAAGKSVERLARLKPDAAVTGHGQPMQGNELADGLEQLAKNFNERAVPDYGKYTDERKKN